MEQKQIMTSTQTVELVSALAGTVNEQLQTLKMRGAQDKMQVEGALQCLLKKVNALTTIADDGEDSLLEQVVQTQDKLKEVMEQLNNNGGDTIITINKNIEDLRKEMNLLVQNFKKQFVVISEQDLSTAIASVLLKVGNMNEFSGAQEGDIMMWGDMYSQCQEQMSSADGASEGIQATEEVAADEPVIVKKNNDDGLQAVEEEEAADATVIKNEDGEEIQDEEEEEVVPEDAKMYDWQFSQWINSEIFDDYRARYNDIGASSYEVKRVMKHMKSMYAFYLVAYEANGNHNPTFAEVIDYIVAEEGYVRYPEGYVTSKELEYAKDNTLRVFTNENLDIFEAAQQAEHGEEITQETRASFRTCLAKVYDFYLSEARHTELGKARVVGYDEIYAMIQADPEFKITIYTWAQKKAIAMRTKCQTTFDFNGVTTDKFEASLAKWLENIEVERTAQFELNGVYPTDEELIKGSNIDAVWVDEIKEPLMYELAATHRDDAEEVKAACAAEATAMFDFSVELLRTEGRLPTWGEAEDFKAKLAEEQADSASEEEDGL